MTYVTMIRCKSDLYDDTRLSSACAKIIFRANVVLLRGKYLSLEGDPFFNDLHWVDNAQLYQNFMLKYIKNDTLST